MLQQDRAEGWHIPVRPAAPQPCRAVHHRALPSECHLWGFLRDGGREYALTAALGPGLCSTRHCLRGGVNFEKRARAGNPRAGQRDARNVLRTHQRPRSH
jgi:hypothetical protein